MNWIFGEIIKGITRFIVIISIATFIIGIVMGYGCSKIVSKYKLTVKVESVTNSPSIK